MTKCTICLLPSAYCLLPTAISTPQAAHGPSQKPPEVSKTHEQHLHQFGNRADPQGDPPSARAGNRAHDAVERGRGAVRRHPAPAARAARAQPAGTGAQPLLPDLRAAGPPAGDAFHFRGARGAGAPLLRRGRLPGTELGTAGAGRHGSRLPPDPRNAEEKRHARALPEQHALLPSPAAELLLHARRGHVRARPRDHGLDGQPRARGGGHHHGEHLQAPPGIPRRGILFRRDRRRGGGTHHRRRRRAHPA